MQSEDSRPQPDAPPQYSQPQQSQPPGAVQQQWGYPQPQMGYPQPVMMQPQQQQQSVNNTTVVVNQQQQPAAPAYKPPRAWTSGICGCFDDFGVCCCVWFCAPCAACQLATDMGENCCVPLCVPGWLIVLRTKLRTQHNIHGSVMDDCCSSTCCYHCVMCQMMREVKITRGVAY
ncbi:placenta-specific gene 8 protein-like [Pomacea canaliculata]|uniref:placenta-specific gene 8 protein-like n=1 Tax=Pomacea canaliculata TaxID=400727 RepID=UPI000D737FE6|nr:placenta-specific gene 8 protein-like [Pomacea canaliculata]